MAEYHSMATTVCEIQSIFYVLQDLQVAIPIPIPLRCDNKVVVHISDNPIFHECTKHLDIDYHIVRQHVIQGFLTTLHITAQLQLIDLFTKPLNSNFHLFLSKMGFVSITQSPS